MSLITYEPTKTIYHEINMTFDLPNKAVKPAYYTIEHINGLKIKCSKYDYTGYSIWQGKTCLEDRFKSLEEARNCAKNLQLDKQQGKAKNL